MCVSPRSSLQPRQAVGWLVAHTTAPVIFTVADRRPISSARQGLCQEKEREEASSDPLIK